MFRTLPSIVALAALLTAPAARAEAARPGLPAASTPPQAQSKPSGRSAAKPVATGPININTASATELEGLPGIGAKTAQRIVEYRQKNGPFKKVEELMNVRGIGEKNFLKLKPQISVGTTKADEHQAAR
jgi:competence protein ComEA